MSVADKLLPIAITVCATAGFFVGFNGDGGLHKALLILCGIVTGFLIDYIFQGEKS